VSRRLCQIDEDRLDLAGNPAVRLVKPFGKKGQIGLIASLKIGCNELVLAPKMIIKRLLGQLGLFRHRIDADAANALRVEKAACSIDNALAGRIGSLCHPANVYQPVSVHNSARSLALGDIRVRGKALPMSDSILIEVRNEIALLTLNRPDKLNALNYETNDRLLHLLDRIEDDGAIRAVILTGAGEKAFSAGGDIHEFSQSVRKGAEIAVKDFVRRGQTMTARLEAFRKPIIAAVNGIAFGGGCEITEAVHLAIASERAIFAKPEINLGMPPTFGGTHRLPRIAGRKHALELMLTGDTFSPERAYELGLMAAASIITAVTRGLNMTIGEGLALESEQFARVVPTHDLKEGLDAWIERRMPAFTGN
jgi:enoyl-CoA hydratase